MSRLPGLDLLTLIAIAVIAYSSAAFIHEGIGHGGACLVAGGKPIALSSAHFECDREDGRAGIVVSAGGTVANLVAGATRTL